jgi:hypothetical protein
MYAMMPDPARRRRARRAKEFGRYRSLHFRSTPINRQVGWCVVERESAALFAALFKDTVANHPVPPGQLTLHADRGAPMRAKTTVFRRRTCCLPRRPIIETLDPAISDLRGSIPHPMQSLCTLSQPLSPAVTVG